jgi:hypothetical protein
MAWRAQLHNIREDELDQVVWRYLTFPKFVSLVSYGALWFQRLCYLSDDLEGTIPHPTIASMKQADQHWKQVFTDPALQAQIDTMPERNVADGRSLTLANCWYLGNCESEQMWKEYGQSAESVVVRSTVRRLWANTHLWPEWSFIGPVQYVDHATFQMSHYHAHQAHHRAFLKDSRQFTHEQELRLTTINLRTPACLDCLGRPYSVDELNGVGMNNFDSAGLYVKINVTELFEAVVTHPDAPDWFYNLVRHIQIRGGYKWTVEKSAL